MVMFCNSRRRSLGPTDFDYYLYLLVFMVSYLLLKEVFSQLPEVCRYFYPQLVAVIAGTIFFGVRFGLANAILSPLIFFFLINRNGLLLIEELSRAFLAFLLVLLFFKQLSQPNFWKLLLTIIVAELGWVFAQIIVGSDWGWVTKEMVFLLPGMVFGSILSLVLLNVLCKIECRKI